MAKALCWSTRENRSVWNEMWQWRMTVDAGSVSKLKDQSLPLQTLRSGASWGSCFGCTKKKPRTQTHKYTHTHTHTNTKQKTIRSRFGNKRANSTRFQVEGIILVSKFSWHKSFASNRSSSTPRGTVSGTIWRCFDPGETPSHAVTQIIQAKFTPSCQM